MDADTAEVAIQVVEFVEELSQWSRLCEHLADRGIKPSEIAAALNRISVASGRTAEFEADDCR